MPSFRTLLVIGSRSHIGTVAIASLIFGQLGVPPCLEEIPLFVRLQGEYKDRNVTFIGIAVDDADRVREFVRDNEINYPILIGSGDALRISEILGNKRSGLPFTVFLTPSGDLVDMHSGIVPESKVRQFVDKIR